MDAMTQVWFVTGSSRGLGRSLAEAVLAAGHRLVATARRPEQLDDLVQKYGDRIRAVPLDVTDPAAARSAIGAAVETFGRIDVVVNNAGYANIAAIEQFSEDDLRAQIETNLFGVVNVTRTALPVFRAQRSGHFLQVSSVGGRLASPGLGAYQTAKWAVGGFSGVLAAETAHLGIRVTVIEPGGFRTDWAGSSMTIGDVDPDYVASVGASAERTRVSSGSQKGDPAKAAQAMLQVAAMEEPPLRLLLGSDAYELATAAARRQLDSDEKYAQLSRSTDFA
jgi:NAD(P)-dependent dehydrogenase (short-subunit alcohol dehydrogenase family)